VPPVGRWPADFPRLALAGDPSVKAKATDAGQVLTSR